ncbi:hypothetical protein [Microbacterium sp. W4I20]|uniref:hypothetical protein n=1 Tax=Microbacterium sp. W4I20 TaxID=3042262 RepID=UPI00277E7752|nr:hypothetical protein [Microbacterium sp. W4I20]MDQ0729091.1 hypothetical protein [Microbacterium sp. W4I20]
MTAHGEDWSSTDPEVVPLLITPGFDGGFNLRFPEEYADEIKALLDDQGLSHSTAADFSDGVDLAIEAVKVLGVPGALAGLAAVIRIVVHRHDGKKFVLKRGDEEIQATGYSDKQVKDLIDEAARKQAELDGDQL